MAIFAPPTLARNLDDDPKSQIHDFIVVNHSSSAMFKKALAHKSNATPLKSSSRRQLVASVLEQYPALRDSIASEEGAPGISEKDLGRALVPDGVRVANIETSAGVEGVRLALWLN